MKLAPSMAAKTGEAVSEGRKLPVPLQECQVETSTPHLDPVAIPVYHVGPAVVLLAGPSRLLRPKSQAAGPDGLGLVACIPLCWLRRWRRIIGLRPAGRRPAGSLNAPAEENGSVFCVSRACADVELEHQGCCAGMQILFVPVRSAGWPRPPACRWRDSAAAEWL